MCTLDRVRVHVRDGLSSHVDEVDVLDSGGKKSERRVNDQEMKPRLAIHKH